MRKLIVILMLAVAAVISTDASAPRWETVNVPGRTILQEQLTDSGEIIDLAVNDGYVYIGCTRQVSVKVFTILGQLISQETLQSGTHRLKLGAKGIYILKIGSVTRRVTI